MGDLLYQYENIESADAAFYATDSGLQEPVSGFCNFNTMDFYLSYQNKIITVQYLL